MNRRPTIVILEPDPVEALSTRKLVLETAKFNVLTAHSVDEGLVVIRDHPKCDALVIHTGMRHGSINVVAEQAKRTNPSIAIVTVSPIKDANIPLSEASFIVNDVQGLVEFLKQRVGNPKKDVASDLDASEDNAKTG